MEEAAAHQWNLERAEIAFADDAIFGVAETRRILGEVAEFVHRFRRSNSVHQDESSVGGLSRRRHAAGEADFGDAGNAAQFRESIVEELHFARFVGVCCRRRWREACGYDVLRVKAALHVK